MKKMVNLKTERLILRGFKSEDYTALYEYLSDEETVRYEPYDAYTLNGCRLLVNIRKKDPAYIVICLKNPDGTEGRMIGNMYFQPMDFGKYELGYIINKEFRHKGYAYEASMALLEYGFRTLGIEEIFSTCNTENIASYKLMEKLGMKYVETRYKDSFFGIREKGRKVFEDVFEYKITALEYFKKENRI